MGELATQQAGGALQPVNTLAEIKTNINLIQQVLRDVMQKDVHYGTIPGCKEPSLLKPGAEKIMATFRLAADPDATDLSTADVARFRVKVRMTSLTGVFIGAGLGECSSDEEKYKWRRASCNEEWNDTEETQRRVKWVKPYNKPAFKLQQVKTNPADLSNTILKMAKKRALVDAVLTGTAASDIFTQDLDDLPPEIQADIAQQSPAPAAVRDMEQDSPERSRVIALLEPLAKQGWEPLQKAWAALTSAERNAVGTEFGRLKKLAESV